MTSSYGIPKTGQKGNPKIMIVERNSSSLKVHSCKQLFKFKVTVYSHTNQPSLNKISLIACVLT